MQEASVHAAAGSAFADGRRLEQEPNAEKGGLPGIPLSLGSLLLLLERRIAGILRFGVLTHPSLAGRSETRVLCVPALQVPLLSAVFLGPHGLGVEKLLNILYAGHRIQKQQKSRVVLIEDSDDR